MARFSRQGRGVYRWSQRRWSVGLQCTRPSSRARRDLRSVEPGKSGSNPNPVSYLRSDPSTLAARQPDPFAGLRKRGRPWLTQAVVPVLQTSDTPVRRRHWGARALASRRGARNNRERGKRSSKPAPCPSLGRARPMLPGEAIHRAPSLNRGGALPGASVLASKEATPPQGVRGEGRQKAWLLGVISRPDRMPVVPVPDGGLPPHQTSRARVGWKHP
jgi:hypothetical protein